MCDSRSSFSSFSSFVSSAKTNNLNFDHERCFLLVCNTFAGHPRPQPQSESVVAAAGDLSRQQAQRMREERNRLEKAWYNGLMAKKGHHPRFFNGRVTINDEKDESGVYALAYQTAEAAAGHINNRKDTQVVIFADAAMDPTRQTNTSAGVGVAFRRRNLMVADAPDGVVDVWLAWHVWTEDEPFNTTSAEILALSYGIHVAIVELYRLEARLVAEKKKRRKEKNERKAARRPYRHNRKVLERERRRARDREAKKSKAQRRQEKAARKKMRAERRRLRQQKRAEKQKKRRTKVTVKIFTDSAAALLLLDGQLPITANSGLRMPAVEAIRQSMELKRRFVNRAEALAVMDVSLELHWVPGHGRFAGEASRRLHNKADKEAVKARDMASSNSNNWPTNRSPWRSPADLADLNGDLPECNQPPVTFALEHC